MLGQPSRHDVVSRLTYYVEGPVEHLYWGSMMRHIPELKQSCMITSVDLRLDFSPSEESCGAANTLVRFRRWLSVDLANVARGRRMLQNPENKYSVTYV